VREHSSICLKRFRHIEGVFKRGIFALALVDAKEALGKAKRGVSTSSSRNYNKKTKNSFDRKTTTQILDACSRPPHKRSEQQLVQKKLQKQDSGSGFRPHNY
jgi:hypothetical protein